MSNGRDKYNLLAPLLLKVEQSTSERELDAIINPQIIAAYKQHGLSDEVKELEKAVDEKRIILTNKSTLQTEGWLKKFITQDKDMILLKDKIRKLSKVDDPVLISGETGTGKEILARALHGDRRGKFIALNCAGMPEHLIESELFGHVKGAFTDAKESKLGLMKAAMDGTLFLDEIGELKITLQAKMLRAIQERRIRRVGANDEEIINCRFVAATHHELTKETTSGNFREDLYHRLAVFRLYTKPLRNRPDDIALISSILMLESNKKIPMERLMALNFPGNVRELQTVIRRFIVLDELPE